MNLSKHTLTTADTDLLDLGLSFIPTVNRMHVSQIQTSLHRLIRSLKLRDFFDDDDDPQSNVDNAKAFTEPSTWVPPNKHLSLSTKQLITQLEETTENILRKYPIRNNAYYFKSEVEDLSQDQKQSLHKLRDNTDIIIKSADKGGMVCVLDANSYLTEVNRQLNNIKYYKTIEEPLLEQTIPKINNTLEEIRNKGYINNKQFNYLSAKVTDKPRKFYLLPKIHKPKNKWTLPDMPEGRPIVGDCATESRRISEYIDSFLKPMANKHPSYIKDTYDFVNKIRNRKILKHYILVTGDVTALYTNMNIDRTLDTVKDFFGRYPDPKRPDKELLELLEIAMKSNDFSFCHKFFLQIFGTAMGKTFAPNLANIYLVDFDQQACDGFHINPLDFFRFLDDIFFLWPGTIEELKQYENFLNSLIPDIKVTLTHSDTEISFLDTTVFKHTLDGIITLQTKVYFKETDTHQLLHRSSFHPTHTFKGILKSQVLRFKRLSSFKTDFDWACHTLFCSLKQRGYSSRMLRKTKFDVWNNNRPNTRNTSNTNHLLPIVIPYNPLSKHLVYEWKKLIIQNECFKDKRIIAAFSRNRNLGELLVPRKPKHILHTDEQVGSSKCNSKTCKACKHITVTKTYTSTHTRRQYNIARSYNCKSTNIVYLITCSLCKKQYVGETQRKLSERLADHRSNIRTHKNTPIANHFNLPGHSVDNVQITPIDSVTAVELLSFRDNPGKLKRRLLHLESYHQHQLFTFEPHGINLCAINRRPTEGQIEPVLLNH